jgi:four helix bundle protein
LQETNTMPYAEHFRDLDVYKAAQSLSLQLFEISKSFPKEERYSLTDQMRRSARSIGAQIAEAWGKRRYEKHFISKLTDADGELYETQHWIQTAGHCSCISQEVVPILLTEYQLLSRMINSMINKSGSFCI